MITHDEKIKSLLSKIDGKVEEKYNYFHDKALLVPSRKEIISLIKDIQELMFPDYFRRSENAQKNRCEILDSVFISMKRQMSAAYSFCGAGEVVDTESLAYSILDKIPDIKDALIKDVQAIYEGDPAARSPEEIILSYPGFYAISIYRIAHEFYLAGIPCISRVMTEFAHEKTGIDIHAGATIGEYFFIDHGTGIVIGETTTIGNNVKIYQGVTLGAKSFELDADGNPIKGIKRHPDIGDNCVIYANATILGGNTKIGDGCVIGGNVWLTRSVDAGQVVYYNNK
ncbi:MAG: serine acetyltransferase [Clostridia bacterium]|nr:serine acetyltransferase [Clostridia bacterium]